MSNSILQKLADEQTNTLTHHVEHGSQLSTESRLQTFVDAGKSTLSGFLTTVSTFLNGLKVGNYKRKVIVPTPKLNEFKAGEYADIRNQTIRVPAGLSASAMDLLGDITKSMPMITALEVTLKTVIVKLAQLLNEPDRLKAQSGIRDAIYTLTHLHLADQSALDKLTSNYKEGTRTETTFGKVFARKADLDNTLSMLVTLDKQLAGVDYVVIQKQLTRIAELVGALNVLLTKEEYREVSGIVAGQLSDVLYRLGVTITLSVVVVKNVSDLIDSINTL